MGVEGLSPKNTEAELQTAQIIPKYGPNEINRKQSSTIICFMYYLTPNIFWLTIVTYENLLAVYFVF